MFTIMRVMPSMEKTSWMFGGAEKSSKQVDTAFQDYVETLKNNPSLCIGDGCSDADLMIAAHWLGQTTRPGSEPRSLFPYREGDDGYKRYSMGRVDINMEVAEVDHRRYVILCNRVSIHWTPTPAIENMDLSNCLLSVSVSREEYAR